VHALYREVSPWTVGNLRCRQPSFGFQLSSWGCDGDDSNDDDSNDDDDDDVDDDDDDNSNKRVLSFVKFIDHVFALFPLLHHEPGTLPTHPFSITGLAFCQDLEVQDLEQLMRHFENRHGASLMHLRLDMRNLDDVAANEMVFCGLSALVYSNRKLESLVLQSNTRRRPIFPIAILCASTWSDTLRVLDLYEAEITDIPVNAKVIAQTMPQLRGLNVLRLHALAVSSQCGLSLSSILRNCAMTFPQLTTLDIEKLPIEDRANAELLRGLCRSKSVKNLRATVESEGAKAMAQVFRTNNSLEVVWLVHRHGGRQAAQVGPLLRALSKNKSVTCFQPLDFKCGQSAMKAMECLVTHNRTLRELHLEHLIYNLEEDGSEVTNLLKKQGKARTLKTLIWNFGDCGQPHCFASTFGSRENYLSDDDWDLLFPEECRLSSETYRDE
jgi:hypothetical protein